MPQKELKINSYKVGDKMITFQQPLIMGVLNVTPDSFFDGGKYTSSKKIKEKIAKMVEEGMDIIDIGASSSRPGSIEINEKEELKRLIIPLCIIRKSFPNLIISIDTYRSSVVDYIVKCFGPVMVNDIYGGTYDKNMAKIVSKYNLPYILMHMQGTPQTMQYKPTYTNVVEDIHNFFGKQLVIFIKSGAKQLFLDPGFGFGKTLVHNYTLLGNLGAFALYGFPIVVGLSRKSMICKLLKINPENALNGTTALHTISLLNGANLLRVHDVKEAIQVKKIISFYQKYKNRYI